MPDTDLERQVAAISLLDEPIRRGLYLYVAERRSEVGRDEAARALRISRALAAFHLDKLVHQGLLDTSYRRLTDRRGPGAGRPAKLYHRSTRQLDLTLPERRYELAGRVLARALTEVAPAARGALQRAARAEGRRLGADARRSTNGKAGTDRLLANAIAVLDDCGYDPAR
ncbi:MAG TPA: hypothetical protein VEO58_02465, partial [Gemmatimonadales bacterium]|nr:hypothetical protein [Gemmatimonadales bacterium]